jgi:hypothetical protein
MVVSMTKDEIIEMANKAGMDYLQYLGPEAFEKVVVFSKLVAQHEREACANLCDVLAVHPEYASEVTKLAAMAIRARGQA